MRDANSKDRQSSISEDTQIRSPTERRRTGSTLGLGDDVVSVQDQRQGRGLNLRRLLEAHLQRQALQNRSGTERKNVIDKL